MVLLLCSVVERAIKIVKHTKYHSSVQHVSLVVRLKGLGLGSVVYSCGD